jgi:hypothetical protein
MLMTAACHSQVSAAAACRGTAQPGNGNTKMTLIMTALEIPPIRSTVALSCATFLQIFQRGRLVCLQMIRQWRMCGHD